MSNKLNVPSFNYLIPREHRIRAIQDLYGHVGDSTGTATEEDLAAETAAREKGDKELSDKIDSTNTALSDLADNVGDLQNTKADKTDLDTLSTKVDANTTNIANKASTSDLNALKTTVGDNTTSITNLTATVGTKADASDLDNYYTKTEVDTITGDIKSALVTINGEDA